MYYVLGTPTCQYCTMAKEMLVEHSVEYKYIDLTEVYGPDNWRQAFSDTGTKQKTIPIILKSAELIDLPKTGTTSMKALMDAGATVVGTLFDMEDELQDIKILDDY